MRIGVRTKTLLLITTALAVAMAVFYGISQAIVLQGFEGVEENDVREHVAVAKAAMDEDLSQLESKMGDWAIWDDSYDFVQTRDPAFIKSNLVDTTFSQLGIEFMLFLNPSGELVYGKGYDAKKAAAVPVPDALLERVKPGSPLARNTESYTPLSGLVVTSEGTMVVVSRPILTSDGRGPPAGRLVAGYRLEATRVAALSKRVQLDLKLIPTDEARKGGDTAKAMGSMSPGDPVLVRPLNDSRIAGYSLFNDVFKSPAFLLRIETDRPVHEQGGITLTYLLVFVAAAGLILSLAFLGLLERVVLSRLAALRQGVGAIGAKRDVSARVAVTGSDELSDLGKTINDAFSELESAQSSLKESEAKFRGITVSAQDAIVMLDEEARVMYWNPAAQKVFGYSKDEVLGREMFGLIVPERLRRMYAEEMTGLRHGAGSSAQGKALESSGLRKGDKEFPAEFSFSAVRIEGAWSTIAIIRDISERRAVKVIQHMARHDALTDLPNRLLFQDRLRQALAHIRRSGEQLAVLFLDLDHFKDINDTLGHTAGDRLLKAVAARLQGCVRRSDTVSRLGGDEFAIIQTAVKDAEGSATLAQKVLDVLSAPFEVEGHEIHTGASIGITLVPHDCSSPGCDDPQEPDQLLKRADMAMYRAKGEGRGVFRYYDSEMGDEVEKRIALVRDLRHAIERGELELHYQPEIDLLSGRVVAAEALLRWNHPERGSISPVEFIPIAEGSGLIVSIGEWVLRTAATQNRQWREAGLPAIRIAVNASAIQLRRPDYVESVARTLAEVGLEGEALEIEITESVLMQNVEANTETLGRLNELGMRISIDDFGTGYSSLSYLKRFPVDELKIDRSFIHGLAVDADARNIARAVIGMGHSLGMSVLAEGVETEEELEFLRREGCDKAQGFLFSKPVPAERMTEILRASEAGPARRRTGHDADPVSDYEIRHARRESNPQPLDP